jgi:hypothetical protein
MLLFGIPLMLAWWRGHPDFFRRRREIAPEEGETGRRDRPRAHPGRGSVTWPAP